MLLFQFCEAEKAFRSVGLLKPFALTLCNVKAKRNTPAWAPAKRRVKRRVHCTTRQTNKCMRIEKTREQVYNQIGPVGVHSTFERVKFQRVLLLFIQGATKQLKKTFISIKIIKLITQNNKINSQLPKYTMCSQYSIKIKIN